MTRSHRRPLPESLRCPGCGQGLVEALETGLECEGCASVFPVQAGLPWLFRDVASIRAQWAAKWQHFLNTTEQEMRQLQEALGRPGLMKTTQERLVRAIEGRQRRAREMASLLEPYDLARTTPMTGLPEDRIPSVQHLGSYLDTVFRDWVWGEPEVRETAAWLGGQVAALGAEPSGRSILVLGGGAGRLTCELAARCPGDSVVQLDINPLLTRVADLAAGGEPFTLTELPDIPLGLDHVAVAHEIAPAATPSSARPQFLLGDVFRPPFADGSFDLVVTPWFVDVLPEDFRWIARRVNRLLCPGGSWISFGPLSFEALPTAARYTPEEMLEALEQAGMGAEDSGTHTVAYLHSPHAMSRRGEVLFGFRAVRRQEAPAPEAFRFYPSWMTDSTRSIPELPVWTQQQHQKVFDVQILGLIDGRRSIDDVVAALCREYGLPAERCRAVVDRFFASLYEKDEAGG